MNNMIVPASMLVEGIVCGMIAYVMFRKKCAKLALCQKTWGEVIDVKEHSGGEGPTRHPVIRYKTTTGEEVTFESKFGSSSWKVKTGDRLEILASPGNPSDAEVVSFMVQWGMPLVFGIISVSSIIGAPVLYMVLEP